MLPKDYVSVATRVDQFHTDHDKGISIDTTFTLQGDVACFKAIVTTKKGTFTGSSFGKLGREKAFEKLETVAVGRALAFAGYETREGIASKEEMEIFDANNTTTSNETPTQAQNTRPDFKTDVIDRILQETDSNAIDTILANAKGTEKQIAWAKKTANERKIVLKQDPAPYGAMSYTDTLE